jgi:anti-sigma regulatory factor (Ser/Thr protein kinase)
VSEGFGVVLPSGVHAAGAARRAIAQNASTLPPSLQDDLSLLVTELVSNAVLHGGAADDGAVQVEFRRQADRIRVEVVDPGTAFDPPASPTNGDSSGGWGLFLVDQIAERWGVSPAPVGTCVWFELPAGAAA